MSTGEASTNVKGATRRRGRRRTAPASETTQFDVSSLSDEATSAPRSGRLRSRVRGAGLGVWIGLLVAAAGFGLIALTWGKTASLVDVAAQVPYLVSGGLTGLGLILVGVLLVNLAVKRRDARERERQQQELREALERLRAAIEGQVEAKP